MTISHCKITLISPYPDITALGIRGMSSLLKQEGFETQLIFLPNHAAENSKEAQFVYLYEQAVLDELIELCEDSSLVGFSLMTNYFEGAVQITNALKSSLQVPVVWGGIHPTIRPEECLDYADIVCIGEGEHALLELARSLKTGNDYHGIENLCLKKNGTMIQNKLRPLIQDLDSLPFPDFDLDSQYILEEKKIRPMNEARLQKAMAGGSISSHLNMVAYQTMTTRGCPHKCTYCCNSTLRNLYHGQRYVRRRTAQHIIDELLQITTKFLFIQAVWFSDDSFFAASDKEIEQFSQIYKEKIKLPFFCLGSPTTINEKKMASLVDAGMLCIQMGIQSGSERVCKEIYRRRISNHNVNKAAHIINQYKAVLRPPLYDIILDNDYETEADILDSLNLIIKLPRPYRLQLFSLVLYPGTELYNRAKAEGLIRDDREQIYRKRYRSRQRTYLNLVFSLLRNGLPIPRSILKILIHKHVVRILNRRYINRLYGIAFDLGRWVRKWL